MSGMDGTQRAHMLRSNRDLVSMLVRSGAHRRMCRALDIAGAWAEGRGGARRRG